MISNFLRQKLYSFSWIVTDGKVKFLSPELSLSQLQGEESYPPGIQGIGESLLLGALLQGQNHRLGGEDAIQTSRITTNASWKARRQKLNADRV